MQAMFDPCVRGEPIHHPLSELPEYVRPRISTQNQMAPYQVDLPPAIPAIYWTQQTEQGPAPLGGVTERNAQTTDYYYPKQRGLSTVVSSQQPQERAQRSFTEGGSQQQEQQQQQQDFDHKHHHHHHHHQQQQQYYTSPRFVLPPRTEGVLPLGYYPTERSQSMSGSSPYITVRQGESEYQDRFRSTQPQYSAAAATQVRPEDVRAT